MKFKFPASNTLLLLAGSLNFKLRIVFFGIFFFEIWRFEKQIALSEKKPPLAVDSFHETEFEGQFDVIGQFMSS